VGTSIDPVELTRIKKIMKTLRRGTGDSIL